jgi:hypothetical protein
MPAVEMSLNILETYPSHPFDRGQCGREIIYWLDQGAQFCLRFVAQNQHQPAEFGLKHFQKRTPTENAESSGVHETNKSSYII